MKDSAKPPVSNYPMIKSPPPGEECQDLRDLNDQWSQNFSQCDPALPLSNPLPILEFSQTPKLTLLTTQLLLPTLGLTSSVPFQPVRDDQLPDQPL